MPTCAICGITLPADDAICARCGETRATEATAATVEARNGYVPGTVLAGRYRIIALLGRGGMGEVYRADDLSLGQQVALKFLPAALSRNENALRRFRNEVRTARQVSHPNVCRVYDLGEVDGTPFLSMEYVDGEDLATLLRRIGRLPSDKGLEIARKLCAGLAAAHEKGVLHRDLKPGNVMLDARGHVRLTDFGLAGLAEEIQGAEVRSGTPAYMAPEQLTGKEVTVRSDIYALGLVLYELFTGKRPHESDSLQDLIRLRSESAPETPASHVRDLDPAVESVILRCLEPNPASRPASAFAVAGALPGGDPIADALAAGETPSPQMIAAAGEGEGLAPKFAIPVFAAILIGCFATAAMAIRTSALERIQPELPPEVLAQRAKDLVASAGYNARPADNADGFYWYLELVRHVGEKDKPRPRWDEILARTPSVLRYWYRQSDAPLIATEFHSDLLIPGEVTATDPPQIISGMVRVNLDARGLLVRFEAMPPQLLEQTGSRSGPPDWIPFFRAAGLDASKLQRAEPSWTWLATSDNREAWTGTWPGTSRPLRVEAASLQGRAIAFALLGPWDKPDRVPDAGGDWKAGIRAAVYGLLFFGICGASAWLARRNLAAGRGDRRGALRLAVFICIVHMAMWLTCSHIVPASLLGLSLLALCTAVFYGVILWTVYLALEPYVRRHWPRTLISWSRLLAGQWRDPIVGRDVLIGAALGVAWTLTGRVLDVIGGGIHEPWPTWTDERLLMGTRDALGAWLARGPHHLRDGLLFFSLLFLLRVVLRNQWLGAAAFVLLLTVPLSLQGDILWLGILAGLVIYGLAALVVLRYGLLALTIGFCVSGLIGPPLSLHTGAWYFGNIAFLFGSAILLAAWAFYTSVGGRRFWRGDLFV
jgi:hypothetical protein